MAGEPVLRGKTVEVGHLGVADHPLEAGFSSDEIPIKFRSQRSMKRAAAAVLYFQ
jgi:hypothetical protein